VIIGAALMQVLRNAIVLLDIPTQLEFAIIGGVILIGVGAEEIVRKTARRVGG
jgi:ribose transport system permease protein